MARERERSRHRCLDCGSSDPTSDRTKKMDRWIEDNGPISSFVVTNNVEALLDRFISLPPNPIKCQIFYVWAHVLLYRKVSLLNRHFLTHTNKIVVKTAREQRTIQGPDTSMTLKTRVRLQEFTIRTTFPNYFFLIKPKIGCFLFTQSNIPLQHNWAQQTKPVK